jgi:hypothetical protein
LQSALRINHTGHPQAFARYLQDDLHQLGILRHQGDFLMAMHEIADGKPHASSKLPTRVEEGKIALFKATARHDSDRQRVPHRQRCRNTGGRNQTKRTRFLRHLHIEHDVAALGQGRSGISRNRDQLQTKAVVNDRKDPQNFFGLATVRNRDEHIAAGDHTQIAVCGVGWV